MATSHVVSQAARSRTRSRVWRWTKRLFTGMVGFVLVLVSTGVVYQVVATRINERTYPAPGTMIDVGGYRLHLHCTGVGSPTVVMDAGLGGGVLDWVTVQPEVAQLTRVCTYDRAGTYWSDASPHPRTSQQMVTELHTLLRNAGLQPPYVLVGHSMGGANMQLYASQYPQEVGGMVLVDSSHGAQLARLPATSAPPSHLPRVLKVLVRIGVVRVLSALQPPDPTLPPALTAVEPARLALSSSSKSVSAWADELALLATSLEQVQSARLSLGTTPLIVLTQGKMEVLPGMSAAEAEHERQVWHELQADLTSRSRNGKQIIADESGHYIQIDQPNLVIDSIHNVVAAVRRD